MDWVAYTEACRELSAIRRAEAERKARAVVPSAVGSPGLPIADVLAILSEVERDVPNGIRQALRGSVTIQFRDER